MLKSPISLNYLLKPNIKILHSCEIKSNLLFLLIFCISISPLSAQTVHQYNNPGTVCYSETVFEKKAKNPKGVIVVEVSVADIKFHALNNGYISSGLFSDYNFLYIRVIEKQNNFPLNCYEQIINVNSFVNRIEKSSYYLISEENGFSQNDVNSHPQKYEFKIIAAKDLELQQIKEEIKKKTTTTNYFMPIVYTTQEVDAVKMANYKKNFDIGFNYNPFFLTGAKLGIDKTAIGLLGISLKKNTSHTTALVLNLNYSIANKTKTKEKLQTVSRDTINAHALFGADLTFRKYYNNEEPLRYFSSAGLGFYSLIDVKLRRKQTSVSKKNSENQYITLLYDFGLEYRLSPSLKVNAALPLKYYINNGGSGSLNTFGFGVNMGFSYTLNPSNLAKRK